MDEFEGLEFYWFAVDQDGHVAHFSTAGAGSIPPSAARDPDAQRRLERLILQTPAWTLPVLIGPRRDGVRDDGLAMAAHGFFSYYWTPTGGPYRLIARPSRPALAADLSHKLGHLLERTRFSAICFQDALELDLEDFLR